MASSQGKGRTTAGRRRAPPRRDDAPADVEAGDREPARDESGRLPAIPDLMRKLLTVGLSGFFLTEEAVRKALGDTLPRDWADFAIDQSERTRREFLERLSYEMARSFENVDFAAVLRDLLEGRTLEVKAEIRLSDSDDRSRSGLHVAVAGRDRGE